MSRAHILVAFLNDCILVEDVKAADDLSLLKSMLHLFPPDHNRHEAGTTWVHNAVAFDGLNRIVRISRFTIAFLVGGRARVWMFFLCLLCTCGFSDAQELGD